MGTVFYKLFSILNLRSIYLFFYHKIIVKYKRKIYFLDLIWLNKTAKSWYCNSCGNLVFKGTVDKAVMMNCPHCGAIYQVIKDEHGILYRTTKCGDGTYKITEKDFIDNGVKGNTKILNVNINIKETCYNGKNYN